jgi:formaldehyde-activating enzyme involved in methanogenesis
MLDGLREGVVSESQAEELLCIAVVWIWETATDVDRVCAQTRAATLQALEQAMTQTDRRQALETAVLDGGLHNPYYALSAQDI